MELSPIFFKTAKGLEEIVTRANRLPARVRAMLIMVDGHRTGNQLVALSCSAAEGDSYLASLLQGGFIHASGASAASGHSSVRCARPDEDISLARSYVVRTLHELLGAAAAPLVAEIEGVATAPELRLQLGRLRAALGSAPDQKKAEQFLEELALVLD